MSYHYICKYTEFCIFVLNMLDTERINSCDRELIYALQHSVAAGERRLLGEEAL